MPLPHIVHVRICHRDYGFNKDFLVAKSSFLCFTTGLGFKWKLKKKKNLIALEGTFCDESFIILASGR